jgi:hypothetical protein
MRHLACTALILLVSCATQTKLPGPIRAAISARHMARTIELRQSCYYGELYDENEKWLLSPYPFSETYHIVDLDGAPIHPRGQRGIIPAGTTYRVQEVEFPDPLALAKRMLTTPRYNTWIYLTPTPESQPLSPGRAVLILLIPWDLDSEEAVEKAIAEVIAPRGEVTAWLKERRPTVQAAIANKQMIDGMSEPEVVAAMGTPRKVFADKSGDKNARVLWYPQQEAWLVDSVVTRIGPAREVAPPPPPTPMRAPAGGAPGSPPAPTPLPPPN